MTAPDASRADTAEFRMPSLGADMEAGRLVEWRVAVGDVVHHGDLIAVIETEKSTIDAEVYVDGVVTELLVKPGTKVPVGTPLASIRTGDATGSPMPSVQRAEGAFDRPSAAVATPSPAPSTEAIAEPSNGITVRSLGDRHSDAPQATGAGAVRVSPRARRIAAESGVDVTRIRGTTPDGTVTSDDVLRAGDTAAVSPVESAGSATTIDVRYAIAKAMARSKREIPHYYLLHTIDVTDVMTSLQTLNSARPPADRILPAAVLLRAVGCAARDVPEVNGQFVDGRFNHADGVHVGTAIALRTGGLLAPALRDADRRDIDDTMRTLRDLVERTRSGRLRSSELTDPTITVTNLGDLGVEVVHGVINPPQVAIVGFGRITESVVAHDGRPSVRSVVHATLAADHRVSDGVTGSRFLRAIEEHCAPERWTEARPTRASTREEP